MFIKLIISSFVFCLTLFANPVINTYSQSELLSSHKQVKPGESFYLAFKIKPIDSWHTYWKNPGDSGLAPDFQWQLPDGVKVTQTFWPAPEPFKLGPLVNYGYKDDVFIIHKLAVEKNTPLNKTLNIILKSDWLVCEETCVPESGTYEIDIQTASTKQLSSYSTLIQDKLSKIPDLYIHTLSVMTGKNELQLHFPEPKKPVKNRYYYHEELGYISPSAKQNFTANTLNIPIKKPMEILNGVLYTQYQDGSEEWVQLKQKLKKPIALSLLIIFAFIGGILLNLMPCVLPILSLKLLHVLKHSQEKEKLRKEGLLYTLGVVLSFVSLALFIISLRASGEAIGWGFHLQSPVIVLALAFLMTIIGLNLLDRFPLPFFIHQLAGSSANLNSKKSSNAFLTGVLAVIVASPCTAPFMATAIGFAFTLTVWETVSIFSSLGLGLAFPFLAVSFVPQAQALLPKPGNWMLTFKKLTAIPMFLTAAWLIWVLSMQVSTFSLCLSTLGFLTLLIIGLSTKNKAVMTKAWWITLVIAIGVSLMTLTPIQTIKNTSSTMHIQTLQKSGKAFLVDVTASWCITCQVNKELVLDTKELRSYFKNNDIELVILDWTNKNEEITHYLESFNRTGVPLYVAYKKDGSIEVLPQILTIELIKKSFSEKE